MEYSYYKIDPTGNITAIVETSAERNKQSRIAGLIMAADDGKKDYAYHLRFKLPEQSKVTESYAGAKVCFDISILAEQAQS